MKVSLIDFHPTEAEQLFLIINENDWPFHAGKKLTREDFDAQIQKGYYNKQSVKTFLIQNNDEIVGFIRFFDLGENIQDDETPLFDLRIIKHQRGKGIGAEALNQAIAYIFKQYSNKTRIEGTTRVDNMAMQKVFVKCGFVKEAQYRESWRTQTGELVDTVGYGLLRRECKLKS